MSKDYKKISILLLISILFLYFAKMPVFAQENIKLKEFIVVKLIIKKENFTKKITIPISNNPFNADGRTFIEGEFAAGGWAITHCTNCALSSEFDIIAYAVPDSNNSVEVSLSTNFANKSDCNIRKKNFSLKKGNIFEIKSKCSVKLVAYYSFAAKENNRQPTTDN